MSQQTTITTTGRVTADLELQTSQNGSGTTYVSFSLAVNKGFGDNEHPNFYQCTLFGDAAERIIKAKVKKGSLISIVGDLDLTEFTRNNGSIGLAAKVKLYDWAYAPTSKPKSDDSTGASSAPAAGSGFIPADIDEELPFN